MIKAQTAFTFEVDDVEAAVAEIKEQLDLEALGENAIGIIGALPAFLQTGVVAALQEELPFNLVGKTTIASSVQDSDDSDQLSLLVLSSNTVEFTTTLSEPITGDSTEPIEAACATAIDHCTKTPSFILAHAPLLPAASSDFFIKSMNSVIEGVPVFGGLAVDDTLDYHDSQVIYNGESYGDRLALICFCGETNPRFFLATITYGKVFSETGVVTSSEGSLLKTINGAPVSEFLKGIGIQPNKDGEFIGINTYPYLVDYNDGSEPVIKIMYAVTPEGYAVCGGDIPEGATLSVSYFDAGEIMESSEALSQRLAADILEKGANVVLAYSCIGRYLTLNYETTAEMKLLHDVLDAADLPRTIIYTGGEICPVGSKDDPAALVNRAHNSTLVAVVL